MKLLLAARCLPLGCVATPSPFASLFTEFFSAFFSAFFSVLTVLFRATRRARLTPLLSALLGTLLLCTTAGATVPKTLRIGVIINNWPLSFTAGPQEMLQGFEIELITTLLARHGRRPQFVMMTFEHLLPELENDRLDLVVADLGITREREKKFKFSRPYINSGTNITFLSKERHRPRSIEELADQSVCVERHGIQDHVLSGLHHIMLNYADSNQNPLSMLRKGLCRYALSDEIGAVQYLHSHPNSGLSSEVFAPLPNPAVGMAMPPTAQELKDLIDGELLAMLQDGSYQKIHSKWLSDLPTTAVSMTLAERQQMAQFQPSAAGYEKTAETAETAETEATGTTQASDGSLGVHGADGAQGAARAPAPAAATAAPAPKAAADSANAQTAPRSSQTRRGKKQPHAKRQSVSKRRPAKR